MSTNKVVVKIAPNNPVFDLPVIVGIEQAVREMKELLAQARP